MDLASIGLLPILFILATIAIGALLKGITGLGLPIFAIPALAMFVPVDIAVVVMAVPTLVGNIWLVVVYRQHLPLMNRHRLFLTCGFVGALIGTWLLTEVSDNFLKAALAVWLGVYLLQLYLGSSKFGVFAGQSGTAAPLGLAAGTFQGSMGISAAVVAPYFHAHGLTSSAFAFAVAFTFALLAVGQISAITTIDLFTPSLMSYSLMATLTTVAFMPIGVKIGRHINHDSFDRMLPIVFILIEIKLLYDVFL